MEMAYKHTYPVVDRAPRKQTRPVIDRALSNFLVLLLMLLVVVTITTAIISVFGGGAGAIDILTPDYVILYVLGATASLRS